jgi:beta-N-acetylhexosaminidase
MASQHNAGRSILPPLIGLLVVAAVAAGGFFAWNAFFGASATAVADDAKEQVQKKEPDTTASKVERILKGLTLEQKAAQVFVVEPEAITDVDVVTMAGEMTRAALDEYPVGGLIYFDANLESPDQVEEMLSNVQRYSKSSCDLPMFTCVDEEGGAVCRIASNPVFNVEDVGDMARIGATGDVDQAREAASYIAGYLSDLGFNVDFAPVADIATSDDGTMAERSFGNTPDEVAPMVAAQVKAFGKQHVLCSAKHFPGIGDAEGDSHDDSIYSNDSLDDMMDWSLVPFKEAIKAGVPLVMVGHLSCRGLGSKSANLPASLNPEVIEGILRDKLGYDGLVITDSLQMGAAAEVYDPDQQAVEVLEAGADLVLMPVDFKQAYDGLIQAVKDGTLSEERLDESVRRIILAKLTLL